MAHEEFRLAGAALMLDRFTAEELSDAARVNPNTCRSWLRRHSEYLGAAGATVPTGKGRPAKIYRLKQDGMARLRATMSEIQGTLQESFSDGAQDRLLDRIEEKLRLWQAVNSEGSADQELVSLRASMALAWQEFADLQGADPESELPRLKHLAEMERDANVASPPEKGLDETALWLARRIRRILGHGASLEFAAQAMWVRTEVRSFSERVRVTAAALAAPVWSDEGHTTDDVSESDLLDCRKVAEAAPMASRLEYLWAAIDGRSGAIYPIEDSDAQAMTRGLTSCRDARTSKELHRWLAAAQVMSGWRNTLAPVVVHGLLSAPDVSLPQLVAQVRGSLEDALNYDGVQGRLRGEALTFGRRVLDQSTPISTAPASAQELASMLAWRPSTETCHAV